MFRFTLPLVLSLMLPVGAGADPAKDFLQTPVWYLSYEVSFKTTSQGTYEGGWGPMAYTATLDRVFTHSQVLNLRSEGPGALGMMPTAMQQKGGGQMSVADAQKYSMDLMARMEHTANWMVGGSALNESQSEADVQADVAAMSGELRIQYQRNDKGDNLIGEQGEKFSMKTSQTVNGTGEGAGGGFGSIMLDVDTSAKTFLLSLSLGGGAQGLDRQVINITTVEGQAPQETRETNKTAGDFAALTLDDAGARPMQGGVVVSGTFDPASGKIVGENKYPGHYNDGTVEAPGMVVIKYTLSPTPPAKRAGGR